MKQQYLNLLIGSILFACTATTMAAGIDGEKTIQLPQVIQGHFDQRVTQQNIDTGKHGQKIPAPVQTQDSAGSLLDNDQERLRDLEQEIIEEQNIDRISYKGSRKGK